MTVPTRFSDPELSAAEAAFSNSPNIFALLKVWNARIQSRRALRKLDAHMLPDIGYTAYEIEVEASKPFWKA